MHTIQTRGPLEYQPIFDISSGVVELYEYEAPQPVAHWPPPLHGDGDDGFAIFKQVLESLATNRDIVIATSLPMPLFMRESQNIIQLLDDYLGATSRLVIRLVGGVDMNGGGSAEQVREIVGDVRRCGVRIASDGFVHGYFNPELLRLLRPDFVYIGHPSKNAAMLAKETADQVGGEVIVSQIIVSQSGGVGALGALVVEALSKIRSCGIRYVKFISHANCQSCALGQGQRNSPLSWEMERGA